LCQRFPWPGNVRQLRNVIERLVITCRNAMIELSDLPDFLRGYDQTATTFSIRPGMSLAEAEKLLIRRTLMHVTANRAEAAKLLGISRRSLQYKLKHYGLLDEGGPAATE
jgi:transcriptional regulator with PAS, ATPase and Fis domain